MFSLKDYRNVVGAGATALCLALSGGAANANLVVSFVSNSDVVGGSNWVYDVSLDQTQNVNNSTFDNFVTIYDFGSGFNSSFNAASLTGQLVGWQGAFALTNTPAFQTTPTDNPFAFNFRLTAPAGLATINGPQDLGTFTLFADTSDLSFRTVSTDGQAFQTSAPAGQHGNVGTTVAPVPGPIVGAGLPGLIAACAGLVAFARRRRQKFA